MTAAEAEELVGAIRRMVEGSTRVLQLGGIKGSDKPPAPNGKGQAPAVEGDALERLYLQIKHRLIDDLRIDPVFVQLLANRPELEVIVEVQRVELQGSSMRGRIALLISRGWFGTPRATSAVRRELARTGPDPGGGGGLAQNLAELKRDGFLVSEGEAWAAAPGIKISERVIEATR